MIMHHFLFVSNSYELHLVLYLIVPLHSLKEAKSYVLLNVISLLSLLELCDATYCFIIIARAGRRLSEMFGFTGQEDGRCNGHVKYLFILQRYIML